MLDDRKPGDISFNKTVATQQKIPVFKLAKKDYEDFVSMLVSYYVGFAAKYITLEIIEIKNAQYTNKDHKGSCSSNNTKRSKKSPRNNRKNQEH